MLQILLLLLRQLLLQLLVAELSFSQLGCQVLQARVVLLLQSVLHGLYLVNAWLCQLGDIAPDPLWADQHTVLSVVGFFFKF